MRSRGWSGDGGRDAERPPYPRARLPEGLHPGGGSQAFGDPGYEFDPPWQDPVPGRDTGGWRGDGQQRAVGPDSGGFRRLRGTDGNRTAPGYLGAAVDPAGPAMDVLGSADPWTDLWFYTNPIWVVPNR